MSLNSPVLERRMVYDIYISPNFESVLKPSKTVNQLMKEGTKLQNNSKNGSGATSVGSIYELPDGKKYIVRRTKSNPFTGMRLKNEIGIYRVLKESEKYRDFISNLLYADAHLAATTPYSYFIFEYEDGDVLDEYIEKNKGTKSIKEVLRIYEHLQNAVSYLASKGVVHKDIKPQNIYFSTKRNIPLLFDFDASCMGDACETGDFSGSPQYATPTSKGLRGQEGFTAKTKIYRYSPLYDRHSLSILLGNDLSKLVKVEDESKIKDIAKADEMRFLAENSAIQDKKGGFSRMRRNKTRKLGGMRIGLMNPRWGGKSRPNNKIESILNFSESLVGGGCGCDRASAQKPMMELPLGLSLGPLTKGLTGGACPCQAVPKIPIPLGELPKEGYRGGYRATKRNLKYLKLFKQGKSIGFTMRSSLKAKGLIPRANGKKMISAKYKF
jgi:serine/threonine protein kinase